MIAWRGKPAMGRAMQRSQVRRWLLAVQRGIEAELPPVLVGGWRLTARGVR